MTRREAAKIVSSTVKERAGFEIPWELIIPLIDYLIEECFNTEDQFVEAARDPSTFQMFVVHRQCTKRLRRSTLVAVRFTGRELHQASFALANAVLEVAATMNDGDLRAVFAA